MHIVYNRNGYPVGFWSGALVYNLGGRPVGQLRGAHVYRLSGEYVGELCGDMVVDAGLRGVPGVGRPRDPEFLGAPAHPRNRAAGDGGHPDVFNALLQG
jgi:hypothetical protein